MEAGIAAFWPRLRGVLRRSRFADLVSRQLDLFEEDERGLLAEAAEADDAWTHASAENSEELYGDYQLVVDQIAERLLDLRETYAGSLDDPAAAEYRTAFNRAASKRFRPYAGLLADMP
jgi:hypothetical protein